MLIELTDLSNQNKVSVNPDHIIYAEPNGNGDHANVYVTTHGILKVAETREQVHALANGRQPATVEAVEAEEVALPPEPTPEVEPPVPAEESPVTSDKRGKR